MLGLVRTLTYAAILALAGAALVYESVALVAVTGLFMLVTHLFVVWYEEPTLRRTAGEEYDAHSQRVRRWLPKP